MLYIFIISCLYDLLFLFKRERCIEVENTIVFLSGERLDRQVVSAESMGSFKRRLDESMDRDDRWNG